MAYRIEFSQPHGLPFFAEFILEVAGEPIPFGSNQHSFSVGGAGTPCDYGWWRGGAGPCVEATEANGMLVQAAPGLLMVSIPFARFGMWCGPAREFTAPFRLVANPLNASFASLIAEGTISFGDRR